MKRHVHPRSRQHPLQKLRCGCDLGVQDDKLIRQRLTGAVRKRSATVTGARTATWLDPFRMALVCAMELCSAITRNGLLPSATTWMDLEGIMLGQSHRGDQHRIPLTRVI